MRRLLAAAAVLGILAAAYVVLLEPRVAPSVPVLMFHKTPEFEPVAAWLEHHGCHALTLAQFREFLRGRLHPPPNSVLLTFDDGDATNYLVASEALQRHGLTGVFFLVTDRLGRGRPRPLGADSAGEADTWNIPRGDADLFAARHPGQTVPFSMRWSEARRMMQLGVGEMASHGASHHFAFGSDSLRMFLSRPVWRSIDALGGESRPGAPVFAGRSALLGPSFFADSTLVESLVRTAGRVRGPRGVDSLYAIVRQFRSRGPLGRRETGASYEARLVRELQGSRRRLSDSLGIDVTALAWPWGQYDERLARRARAAGYTLLFTVEPRSATARDDSLHVPRIGAPADPGQVRDLLWIYTRPTLGWIYSHLHPATYPR